MVRKNIMLYVTILLVIFIIPLTVTGLTYKSTESVSLFNITNCQGQVNIKVITTQPEQLSNIKFDKCRLDNITNTTSSYSCRCSTEWFNVKFVSVNNTNIKFSTVVEYYIKYDNNMTQLEKDVNVRTKRFDNIIIEPVKLNKDININYTLIKIVIGIVIIIIFGIVLVFRIKNKYYFDNSINEENNDDVMNYDVNRKW